jgi:hypothetical protein
MATSGPITWNLEKLITLGCLEPGSSSIVYYPVDTRDPNPEATEFHETTHQELARNTSHGMFAHLIAIAAEITGSDDIEALLPETMDRCRLTQEGVATTTEYLFVKEHFPAEAAGFVDALPNNYKMASASLIRSVDIILPGAPLEIAYSFCIALGFLCMHTGILRHFRCAANLTATEIEKFFSTPSNVPDVRYAILTKAIKNRADEVRKAFLPIISKFPLPNRIIQNDSSLKMGDAHEYITAFFHIFSAIMSIPGVVWEDRSTFEKDAESCFTSWILPHVPERIEVERIRMRAWVHTKQWRGAWPIIVGMTPSAEEPKTVPCLELSEMRTMPMLVDELIAKSGGFIYGTIVLPRDGKVVAIKKSNPDYIIKPGAGYLRLQSFDTELREDGSFGREISHRLPCIASCGTSAEVLQFLRERGNRIDTWVIQDYSQEAIYMQGGPLSEEVLRSGRNWLFIRHDRISAESLWEFLEGWTAVEGWIWHFALHQRCLNMVYLILWRPKFQSTHLVPIGLLSRSGVEWIMERFKGAQTLSAESIHALCPAWTSRLWMVIDHNNEMGF